MGITKSNLFNDKQNTLANLCKVFSHPARIAILQYLIKANACINSDLVNELGLAQATISQHLRELKDIGLIQGTIEGVSMSYCINPTQWYNAKELLNHLFESFEEIDADKCC